MVPNELNDVIERHVWALAWAWRKLAAVRAADELKAAPISD